MITFMSIMNMFMSITIIFISIKIMIMAIALWVCQTGLHLYLSWVCLRLSTLCLWLIGLHVCLSWVYLCRSGLRNKATISLPRPPADVGNVFRDSIEIDPSKTVHENRQSKHRGINGTVLSERSIGRAVTSAIIQYKEKESVCKYDFHVFKSSFCDVHMFNTIQWHSCV